MKKVSSVYTKLMLLILSFVAVSCFKEDEPKDKSELIDMWVSAETTVTYHWGDDNHENPIECMQVRYSPDGSWEPMLFGIIEDFKYEKGVEYELSVLRTTLSNLPADGSAYTYRLDRILSHKVVTANMQGIDDCIEVPAQGKDFDIDFTTNAPCDIALVTGDRFGEADLLELYDNGDGCGYSLRLKIPQNSGLGRVKLLTLRFSNGDERRSESGRCHGRSQPRRLSSFLLPEVWAI